MSASRTYECHDATGSVNFRLVTGSPIAIPWLHRDHGFFRGLVLWVVTDAVAVDVNCKQFKHSLIAKFWHWESPA